jgi:hypothetical protein
MLTGHTSSKQFNLNPFQLSVLLRYIEQWYFKLHVIGIVKITTCMNQQKQQNTTWDGHCWILSLKLLDGKRTQHMMLNKYKKELTYLSLFR